MSDQETRNQSTPWQSWLIRGLLLLLIVIVLWSIYLNTTTQQSSTPPVYFYSIETIMETMGQGWQAMTLDEQMKLLDRLDGIAAEMAAASGAIVLKADAAVGYPPELDVTAFILERFEEGSP